MIKGLSLLSRHMSACEDIVKFTFLAERVQQAIDTAIHKEPVRLKPSLVGVSPLNRQFSIKHVHVTILSPSSRAATTLAVQRWASAEKCATRRSACTLEIT